MTQGLRWLRSIFRWIYCSIFTAARYAEHACLFCRAPVTTITHSSLLPTKSSQHEQSLQSFIPLLSSLFTLSALDNSLLAYLLFPQPSLYIYLSACFSRSVRMSHSLFEACELATLSALSIPAYDPRVLERITFLTSLCQMFMTKIDITSNLTTKSKECIYTWLDRRLLCCNNNNINNTIYTKKKNVSFLTTASFLLLTAKFTIFSCFPFPSDSSSPVYSSPSSFSRTSGDQIADTLSGVTYTLAWLNWPSAAHLLKAPVWEVLFSQWVE